MTREKMGLESKVNDGTEFECEMDDCQDTIECGEVYFIAPDKKRICDACAQDISAVT